MLHLNFRGLIVLLIFQITGSLGSKLLTFPQCGEHFEEDRIIGGEDAPLDAYPWLALIEYEPVSGAKDTNTNFLCGGSLITKRYVITAAHCKTSRRNAVSVRLGEHRISTKDDCETVADEENCIEDPVQDIPIEVFTIHEKYVPNIKRKDHRGGQNDVAMIRLVREAQLNFNVKPICLPTPANNGLVKTNTNATSDKLVVAGWGLTESGVTSDVKQMLRVPLVDFKVCDDAFPTRIISKAQICAGGEKGKDACRGDSGGPLMKLEFGKRPFWILVGLVSYGPRCSTDKNVASRPSVYVNLVKYLDWIENQIQN